MEPPNTVLEYLRREDLRADSALPGGLSAADRLRALLNLRAPGPLPAPIAAALDGYLSSLRESRGVVSASECPFVDEPLALWRGDITRLAADAVVNAANSGLLGCFQPLHTCIDNALHTAAGPRLRDACHAVMTAQGHPESVGQARLTPGFQLPARYVIHTVGPQVRGTLTAAHRQALESCYRAVLTVADECPEIRTLAFCSISTGVFGYPIGQAVPVAVATVREWVRRHPGRFDRVIFDVFSAEDEGIYRSNLLAKR